MGLLKNILGVGLAVAVASSVNADGWKKRPLKIMTIPAATQAPVWPPAEIVDENGDFVVVGTILRKGEDGQGVPSIGAAIVSKDTVPPLNDAGVEDFSNPFGSYYTIIRELDLSEGSPDRDIELYSASFGPARGSFGGGGRIPQDGDSMYNLNGLPDTCPEIFPSESQAYTFKRDSFPILRAPVLGFQGDQVAYDVDTGLEFDPMLASGEGCGAGCSGDFHEIEDLGIPHLSRIGKKLIDSTWLNIF